MLIGGTSKALSARVAGPVRAIGSEETFTAAAFPFHPRRERLQELTDLAEEGKVKPHLDAIFQPNDAVEAINYILNCHPQGKVALQMNF